jgi:hypothetical protein
MILVLCYSCFAIPYRLAFGLTRSLFSEMRDGFVDVFFCVDFLMQFLTGERASKGLVLAYASAVVTAQPHLLRGLPPPPQGYYDQDNVLVTDLRKIGTRYVKSWCLIDLIGSVPLSLTTASDGSISGVIRLCKIVRFYRCVAHGRSYWMCCAQEGTHDLYHADPAPHNTHTLKQTHTHTHTHTQVRDLHGGAGRHGDLPHAAAPRQHLPAHGLRLAPGAFHHYTCCC